MLDLCLERKKNIVRRYKTYTGEPYLFENPLIHQAGVKKNRILFEMQSGTFSQQTITYMIAKTLA